MRRKARGAFLLLPLAGFGITFALARRPTSPPALAAISSAKVLRGVPHVRQKPDFCGEACLSMALARLGHDVSQDRVFDLADVDPALGRGAHTPELVRAARRLGFDPGEVWRTIAVGDAGAIEAEYRAMLADLDRGIPSIPCMRYSTSPGAPEHFRLVLGHDDATDEIIYHEPAEADGACRRMKRATFLAAWPLRAGPRTLSLIRLRLDPARITLPPKAPALDDAAFAQHVMALRERAPSGFTVVVRPPFVILGDEPEATVRARAERVVQWTVQQLKREYFSRDPDHIIDVWLLKDAESYRATAWSVYRDRPTTPYGYYSPRHRALIMNIATGGGTLVHEIVHPYVHANFPDAPAWLNEGLGSLYEQSTERDGRIWGLPNWRLAGLQRAIGAGKVPSFRALTATSERDFYDRDPGTHYAQARYLCLYLQERGLLRTFYHRFFAARADDPTGFHTLRDVLGVADMASFQRSWEQWVLGLRFE